MRCKNCGWPNKPSETVCVKCQTPLTREDFSSVDPDPSTNFQPVESPRQQPSGSDGSGLNKTVMESAVFGGNNGPVEDDDRFDDSTLGNNELDQCPKCGYPIRPGAEKCPNCKYDLTGGKSAAAAKGNLETATRMAGMETQHGDDAESTRLNTPAATGAGKFSGTVNPYT